MDIDKYINKDKLHLILKSFSLFILLIIWELFIIYILSLFGINLKTLSDTKKMLLEFVCDFIFMIFILFMYKKDFKNDFNLFFNKDFKNNIKMVFRYWIIGFMIMFASNTIINYFIPNTISTNETLVRELIMKYPLLMLFEVSIYSPIVEEIVFRKSIRDFSTNKYLFIIFSGVLFGFVHIISSLTEPVYILLLIPYSAMGIALSHLYYKSNTIFSSIIAHSIHNTLSFIFLILVSGI